MFRSVSGAQEAIVLAVVALGLVVLAGLAVMLYRRRYFSTRTDETQGFTLADLRQMHRAGQLSDEEYERMRQAVIGLSMKGDDG